VPAPHGRLRQDRGEQDVVVVVEPPDALGEPCLGTLQARLQTVRERELDELARGHVAPAEQLTLPNDTSEGDVRVRHRGGRTDPRCRRGAGAG
jgi:hypothetical protein